jgi:AraC-like DNA-binding protein
MARRVLRAPTERDTVPGSYALDLLRLVARWQISPEEILAGTSVRASDLEEPSARVPLATMNALVVRAKRLTGEPGLGFYLGVQKRISFYGHLGFAMMSAATVRECLELAVQFTPILTSAIVLRLHVEGDVAFLAMEPQVDMGEAEDISNLSLVVGISHLGVALTGRPMAGTAEFEMPEPAYYGRFEHLLPGARFDQPAMRVVFDAKMLDVPLATADRAAMRLAKADCERAFAALDFDANIGSRVRRALWGADRMRGLEEVAAELGVSPRTLSRRLAEQGLAFSDLTELERRERALALLTGMGLSLEEVAERLGYSTVPNFVRAFRRWTGTTPGAYRRGRRRMVTGIHSLATAEAKAPLRVEES